jgi:O-antigen/teichoic acid export membrane protein
MDDLRTRRAAFTAAAGLASSATSVLLGFVATPWILAWLGSERYGAARMTLDWLSQLGIVELGLATALPPLLVHALAAGRDEVSGVLAAGVRAYSRAAAAKLVVASATLLILHHLIPVRPELRGDLRIAWALGTVCLLLTPLAPFRALADAAQRGYVTHLLLSGQSAVIVGVALAAARAGWGIAGQIGAACVGQVAFQLAVVAYSRVISDDLPQAALRGSGPQARDALWELHTPSFLFMAAGHLSGLTQNLVLGLVLGAAAVTPFYLTMRLLTFASGHLLAIGNAAWAALSELDARGRRQDFNRTVIEGTAIIAGLGCAVLAPIAAFTGPFVRLWVGEAGFAGAAAAWLAAASAYVGAITSLWMWCFTGTGRVRTLVPIVAAGAVVTLTVSAAATHWLGPAGPPLGTLVGATATTLWYVPRAMARQFAIPIPSLLRASLTPVAAVAPVAVAAVLIERYLTPATWGGLFLALATTCVAGLGCWWMLALTASERRRLRDRLRYALGSPGTP